MMEGEVAEWLAQLNDEGAPELEDANEFVQLLRTRFDGTSQREEAEAEVKDLKQRGRPVKELVWEVQRVAGKLRLTRMPISEANEEDLMINEVICPFAIKFRIVYPEQGPGRHRSCHRDWMY